MRAEARLARRGSLEGYGELAGWVDAEEEEAAAAAAAPKLVGVREGSPAGVSTSPSNNHRRRPNIHVLVVPGVPLRRLQVAARGACVGSKARRGVNELPQPPEKTFAERLSLRQGQVDRSTGRRGPHAPTAPASMSRVLCLIHRYRASCLAQHGP